VTEDSHGQPLALGSGFIAGPGVIVTCFHVIEGASSAYAKRVGKDARLEVIGVLGTDEKRDLALLAIGTTSVKPLVLDTSGVEVGEDVYAVGNPMGLEGTFSDGIVSGIRAVGNDTLIQLTAPISPGSSGGPVLNSEGEVVGVAVATLKDGQSLNFAVPSRYIRALLSRKTEPTAFAHAAGRTGPSIVDDLGDPRQQGVEGILFRWFQSYRQSANFSIVNHLRYTVTDVYCLVILLSGQQPVDYNLVHCEEPIPPGLAKRVGAGLSDFDHVSDGVELRVLDYRVVRY